MLKHIAAGIITAITLAITAALASPVANHPKADETVSAAWWNHPSHHVN
ncbi:hypothetical protein ABZ545_30535 [Streptomyces abikoensis]|uniref:Uncharacterized protein n=1 Tax=Streptomyces abikoensis TaxID=97398 RepID=A0ABW7TDH9_9ACTN